MTQTRDRPAEEMEITPEMIEAGVIALEEFSGSYGAAQLAAAIYTTMAALAPSGMATHSSDRPAKG